MHKRTIIILAVCILVAGVLGYLIPTWLVSSVTYPVSYQVRDYIGANLNPDGLHFGTGPGGTEFKRAITVHTDVPQKYWIIVSGNLVGLVSPVDPSSGKLARNETKTITFSLIIPEGTPEGQYNGSVTFRFMRLPG